ncbi:MAG: hypothetical protein ACK56I_09325 [bacterium]
MLPPPQTKTPVKTTFRDRCLHSSFVHGPHGLGVPNRFVVVVFTLLLLAFCGGGQQLFPLQGGRREVVAHLLVQAVRLLSIAKAYSKMLRH